MKNIYYSLIGLGVLLVGLTYCTEPYNPPEIKGNYNLLVVDGSVNSGNDSSFIVLSRSRNIGDTKEVVYENTASVLLEDERGALYPFVFLKSGKYALPPMVLDHSVNYKLRILLKNKEYLSESFPIIQTPAIDSISWKRYGNEIRILANTHDDNNNSRYYKWDYVETWEYHAIAESLYEYIGGKLMRRNLQTNNIYTCWRTMPSSTISLASSAGLAKDVISEAIILKMPLSSYKISDKYSILVKQQAVTEKAFNYWVNIKKITEQGGSLFDPQPSQITSNIHCVTDPNEKVIGYIGASTESKQRIFISRKEIERYVVPDEYVGCRTDSVFAKMPGPGPVPPKDPDWIKHSFASGKLIPIHVGIAESTGDTVVLAASKECADCREKGGVTKKPDFWQ